MNCGVCHRPLNHVHGRLIRPYKRIRTRKVMLAPAPTRPGQGPPLGIPNCGHLFHKICLINYWDCGNKTCPRCQGEFNLRQVWNANLPPAQVPGACCRGFEELNKKKNDIQQENEELVQKRNELKRQNVHLKDVATREAWRLRNLQKSPVRKIIDIITN